MQLEFPVGIESSGGHIAEVEGRAAIPANAPGRFQDLGEARQVVVETFVHVVGETRGHQGLAQVAGVRDMQLPRAEPGAGAPHRMKVLVQQGVIDHRRRALALEFHANGDAETREAVGKIRGAIQGVDDPAPGTGGFIVASPLLGEDAVFGPRLSNRLDDQGLAFAVDLRHQVDGGALGAYVEVGLVAGALDGSGPGGEIEGEVENFQCPRFYLASVHRGSFPFAVSSR